ncbi:MAG TPA: alkaline phosphatase family protein, partial [Actinomycetota bacterium]|nr:alkaline phosphatase family protein [Actinomycetota bacterium]
MLATACTGTDDPEPAPQREPSASPSEPRGDGVAVRQMGAWGRKACDLPITYLKRIERGHFEGRAPELAFVPSKPNFFGDFAVTSHSGPWPYLQEVPLTFFGPGHIRSLGRFTPSRPATVADLPATLAELVGLEWPEDRPGRPIEEVLLDEDERKDPPKMILVVVWDGGGWNVLNQWPDAWPHLARLMAEGANVEGTIVGSSPSVTPAVHATIGTGVFPNEHGAVDLSFRNEDG